MEDKIKVELIRTVDNGVQTVGKLYVTGDLHFACDTLERSFKNNEMKISCIPSGIYVVDKKSPTEKIPHEHFVLIDVPNRSGICIHAGNLYTHSLGCILVGKGFADINKDEEKDILNSKNTLKELVSLLPNRFLLKICEAQKVGNFLS